MSNFEIIKDFIYSLNEDEDIISILEEYELSEDDNSKLTKVLAEKALYLDEKEIELSLEEWKEVYIDSVMMASSIDYDLATGNKIPRPKNFASKYIDLAIDKLGSTLEDDEDSYEDGNRLIK